MPGSPYTDLDRPPLDARRLQRALIAPGGLWTRLDLRVETGSTNADVTAAARAGEPEGLVVVAERQVAGRGRRGRAWESPARAGLATSVLLRPGVADERRGWPPASPAGYGWLPLLAGVALVETVVRLAELDASLKWPNDLLVPVDPVTGGPPTTAPAGPALAGPGVPAAPAGDGSAGPAGDGSAGPAADVPAAPAADGSGGAAPGAAKCAGILAEAVPAVEAGWPPAIVLGVGLNVTLRVEELPDGRRGIPATSLRLAGAVATDRDPLLRSLLRGIADWYGRWRAAGGDVEECGLREAYLRHCATIGREVRVLLPAGAEFAGVATTIDADGRLLVRAADGEHRVAAGDVRHLR
jgi:BirA family biotin operon repressor/biotin-[acetyl-CoA-carboxylase] ligase